MNRQDYFTPLTDAHLTDGLMNGRGINQLTNQQGTDTIFGNVGHIQSVWTNRSIDRLTDGVHRLTNRVTSYRYHPELAF